MSSRHSRLSKGIEAFISRITAAGPSAKRPPHMALEVSLRALIPFLLVATLMVGGCDRAKPGAEQASGALADANQRSEEHTSELQSLMRSSYAVFCLTKKNN